MTATRASVRPRFISPATGDALTLEESVLEAVQHCAGGVIEIAGPPGSGKTSALSHLQAVLPDHLGICYRELSAPDHKPPAADVVTSLTRDIARVPDAREQKLRFDLAPWGDDEVIEYCLAQFPHQTTELAQRILQAEDRQLLVGIPELCTTAIHRFARNQRLTSVTAAFAQEVERITGNNPDVLPPFRQSLTMVEPTPSIRHSLNAPGELRRLLRHPTFHIVTLAWQMIQNLERGNRVPLTRLAEHRGYITRDAVINSAARLAGSSTFGPLESILSKRRLHQLHPFAATILYQADNTWAPNRRGRITLTGATLQGVDWKRSDLRRSDLSCCNLSGSDLTDAILTGAQADQVVLDGSCLQRATLRRIQAAEASFRVCNLSDIEASGARFPGANWSDANVDRAVLDGCDLSEVIFDGTSLQQTSLRGAVLRDAKFRDTELTQADFRRAAIRRGWFESVTLTGTIFESTNLSECYLRHIMYPAARMRDVVLWRADLTGSFLAGGNLRGADLQEACLADVHWAGADLRGARLTGVTFAPEQRSTNQYRDSLTHYHNSRRSSPRDAMQHSQAMSDSSCAADLRGCDLRHADITGVDFRQVDLRGARFSFRQKRQLIATGAILD